MKRTIDACVEVSTRRAFATAIDWPGWCRSGRDEEAALGALAEYLPRYAAVVKRAGLPVPRAPATFAVRERLEGNATTDFGAPGVASKSDARDLSGADLDRQQKLLRACWRSFDEAAKFAIGMDLRKGPRGGGRELEKIVAHVYEAEQAYFDRLGGRYRTTGKRMEAETTALRRAFLALLASRAAGETPPKGRRTAPLWSLRYAIRRSAWHALDHAWEIEDRARPAG